MESGKIRTSKFSVSWEVKENVNYSPTTRNISQKLRLDVDGNFFRNTKGTLG